MFRNFPNSFILNLGLTPIRVAQDLWRWGVRSTPFISWVFLAACTGTPPPFLAGIGQALPGGASTAISSVPRGPAIEIQSVTLMAENNANDNTAIPVEFVVAYDQGVFVQLMSLTARQYFERAAQLKNDHPNVIQSWHWEMIPGQALDNQPIHITGDDPVGAVVYADYLNQGDHRIRIGAGDQLRIHLMEATFTAVVRN